MHHTISESSIQPTHRTSKSAPKFLSESQNVFQPLCIGSQCHETHKLITKTYIKYSHEYPIVTTDRHVQDIHQVFLKTQSDKITPKGKLNSLQEGRGGSKNIIRSNYSSKARGTSRSRHLTNTR